MPGTSTPSASSRTRRPRPGRTRRVLAVIALATAVVTAVLAFALGRGTAGGDTAAPATVSTPEAQEFPVFGAEFDQAARAGWAAGQQKLRHSTRRMPLST